MTLSERVTDRNAVACHVIRAELEIVIDEVKTRFRPNKESVPGIKLDSAAEVTVEVITRLIIGAGIGSAGSTRIEAAAQGANAAHELQVGVTHKLRGVDGIEIPKQRPKVEAATVVRRLRCLPENFRSNAKVVIEEHVPAEAGIRACSHRHGNVIAADRARSRRLQRAYAEGNINLLGLREIRPDRQDCAGTQQQGNA